MTDIPKNVAATEAIKMAKTKMFNEIDQKIIEENPHLICYRRGDNMEFYNYSDGVYNHISSRDMLDIVDSALFESNLLDQRNSRTKVKDTVDRIASTLARRGRIMSDDKVVRQKWHINLKNGLLDPTTYTLRPHTPDYFSTVQVPFDYDETATCPQFEEFIEYITSDQKDTARMIQEVFGYCLNDGNPKHKVFYFYGPTARNGKSTTMKILAGLVGKGNVSGLSLAQIGSDNSSVLLSLVGKQINFSDEISTKYIESPRLVSLSSESIIEVNPKYKHTFTTSIKCKFIIACNDMPRFQDNQGIAHRLLIVPFDRQIPIEKRIDRFDEILLEKEGAGILNWAIQGLKLYMTNNSFTLSDRSKEEAEENRLESEPFLDYLLRYYDFSDTYTEKVSAEDLFGVPANRDDSATNFQLFCNLRGIKSPSIYKIQRALAKFSNETKKIKQMKEKGGERYYIGLRKKIISDPIPSTYAYNGAEDIPF